MIRSMKNVLTPGSRHLTSLILGALVTLAACTDSEELHADDPSSTDLPAGSASSMAAPPVGPTGVTFFNR